MFAGVIKQQHLSDPKIRFYLSFWKNMTLILIYSIALNSLDTNFQPLKDGWVLVEGLILMIHIDICLISTLRQLHGYLIPNLNPPSRLESTKFQPFGADNPIIPCVYLLTSHVYLALHLTMALRGWIRLHEMKNLQAGKFSTAVFGIVGVLSVLNTARLAGSITFHYLYDRRSNPLSELPSPISWRRRRRRRVWHREVYFLGRPCRVSKQAVLQTLDPVHYFM